MLAGYITLSNPNKSGHIRETPQLGIHPTHICYMKKKPCLDMASKGDYFFSGLCLLFQF